MPCGYGKILEVDLSTGEITTRPIEDDFARDYIGGMGFGCKIFYDRIGPDVDPLGPENILVYANGPLTGTQAPCAGRTEITTRSPLTGNIGTGNTGGLWGTRLKRAGFDIIIVRGMATAPCYLWIDDDKIEIRPAHHLWGMDTTETTDALGHELSAQAKPDVSVLCIGPAGENLVRYACPMNDYHHTAARGGAGAVMGAKNLKAIAVRGTGPVSVARPEAFRQAAKDARDFLKYAIDASGPRYNAIQAYQDGGSFPHRNYQSGVIAGGVAQLGPDVAKTYYAREESTCYACPISCFSLMEVRQGRHAGVNASRGQHPGVVVEWGAKCGLKDLPSIWNCKEICQRLGMDYVSAAGTVSFAMELFQRGLITAKDTGDLDLSWGNDAAAATLLNRIATRDGFGDLLAQGSYLAAAKIGGDAPRYAMTIKKMEMHGRDPRSGSRGWCVGDLTSPRGGDNVKNTHFFADVYNPNWGPDKLDIFSAEKAAMYCVPPEEVPGTWAGKAQMCKWFEDLYTLLNSLGICFFPAGMNLALGPTRLSELYSAGTGWDRTPEEMMRLAEKVFTVFKACAVKHGYGRADDTWPDRFFTEELPEGPARGAILSRAEIDGLLAEYYALRGWDTASGLPTAQKLEELGLGELAPGMAP